MKLNYVVHQKKTRSFPLPHGNIDKNSRKLLKYNEIKFHHKGGKSAARDRAEAIPQGNHARETASAEILSASRARELFHRYAVDCNAVLRAR